LKDEFESTDAMLEFLTSKKDFRKILKKQNKYLASMRKKHQKERASVQKDQCYSISKLTKDLSK